MNSATKARLKKQFEESVIYDQGKETGSYLLATLEYEEDLVLSDMEDFEDCLKQDDLFSDFISEYIDPQSFIELIIEHGSNESLIAENRKLINYYLLSHAQNLMDEVQASAEAIYNDDEW